MLLYGQPLARIARLTRDQITLTPDRTQLALGPMPLDLPAPLNELARQLRLSARLASLGIHGRSARNTALMDLAATIPPAALARLLGIHITTAGDWAERTAASQAAYAAQVSRRTYSKS